MTKFYTGFFDYFPHRFIQPSTLFSSPFVTKFRTALLMPSISPEILYAITKSRTDQTELTNFCIEAGKYWLNPALKLTKLYTQTD